MKISQVQDLRFDSTKLGFSSKIIITGLLMPLCQIYKLLNKIEKEEAKITIMLCPIEEYTKITFIFQLTNALLPILPSVLL